MLIHFPWVIGGSTVNLVFAKVIFIGLLTNKKLVVF